ncbi:unnamed protein product [Cylicocyclus nassatus]|uniref:Uncharacterized protein n=1 Tax=Cylicocyclus nassatus TaxID=53992 RepID=A0AA36GTF2_CYLNA|nr:unnamed protein product [Cylicocyclus nassatus]
MGKVVWILIGKALQRRSSTTTRRKIRLISFVQVFESFASWIWCSGCTGKLGGRFGDVDWHCSLLHVQSRQQGQYHCIWRLLFSCISG